MTANEIFEAEVAPLFDRLVSYASRNFSRRLDHSECDDVVQTAMTETWGKLQTTPTWKPEKNWLAFLYDLVRRRAIDAVRKKFEGPSLEQLAEGGSLGDSSGGWQPAGSGKTPSKIVGGEEFKQKTISEILQQYVTESERAGRHEEHEALERSIRGQQSKDIAADMSLQPVQRVYDLRSEAFARIRAMIDIHDPNHSALATFFGVARPMTAPRQPSTGTQFSDLLRLLIDDAAAMCPSRERLHSWRNAKNTEAAKYHDVRYHVDEARWHDDPEDRAPGCRLCRDEDLPEH